MPACRTSRARSIRGPAVAVAAVVASLGLLAPGAWAAKSQPDLVPASGQVKGEEYAFKNERLGLRLSYATKNKGERRARPTVTKVYLRHGRQDYQLDAQAVPGLAPGKTDEAENRVNSRNRFPAGGYRLVVCADAKDQVRESNERNNCGRIKDEFGEFYSAYYQYVGTANGTGPGHVFDPGVRENWNATGVGFVRDAYRAGVFTYTVAAGGSAHYSVSGTTSTNCTFSGSRDLPFADLPQSYLTVDWKSESYLAALAPQGGYEIHSSCEPDNPTPGPMTGWVFQTGVLLGAPMPLQFGSRSLTGSYVDPLAIDTTNYLWNLAGGP